MEHILHLICRDYAWWGSLLFICATVVFWERHSKEKESIPGPRSPSLLLGHLAQLHGVNALKHHLSILDEFGGVARIYGLLLERQIYISDPFALRHILNTRPNDFRAASLFTELNRMIFGNALTAVTGAEHKRQRKILNPAFSPSRTKECLPTIHRIANQLVLVISSQSSANTINALDLLWRAGIQVIGEAGLGHDFRCLDASFENPYTAVIKGLFPTLDKLKLFAPILPSLANLGFFGSNRFFLKALPREFEALANMLEIIDETGRQVFAARKAAVKDPQHRDIITQLLREQSPMLDRDIISQISLIVFASAETTSGALARVLHQLAKFPVIQSQLRSEISQAKPENIINLPFLDAVIKETLRVFPPVVHMERTALRDTLIPLHTPLISPKGDATSILRISKGQTLVLGIANCNLDSNLWGEDARNWKPTRWLSPLPESLVNAHVPGIYSHMMTFMGGERSCIGYSIAVLEMKIFLATLLTHFKFDLPDVEVEWLLGHVQYPAVIGSKEPQLPLKVTMVPRIG